MEVINSFFSNIKDKLTNPFFGTLILVLLIHHWELWYTIFNFDDDCTLHDKIVIIKNYVAYNLTFGMFICDILKAAGIMLIGYFVVVGTRSITMWIEFGLMPFITGKIVNKNVVRKEEFDDVVKEREKYFDQYEEQRIKVRNFSKDIDEQTEQIKTKNINFQEQSETVNKLQSDLNTVNSKYNTLNEKFSKLEKDYNELNDLHEITISKNEGYSLQLEQYKNLLISKESERYFNSIEKFPIEIINKVKELKNEDLWKTFLRFGQFHTAGIGTIDDNVLKKMIEKGIAFEYSHKREFTPIGKIIWHYVNLLNHYEY